MDLGRKALGCLCTTASTLASTPSQQVHLQQPLHVFMPTTSSSCNIGLLEYPPEAARTSSGVTASAGGRAPAGRATPATQHFSWQQACHVQWQQDKPSPAEPVEHSPACSAAGACADVDIDTLPLRRTDNARILDKTKHVVKLYTSDAGTKLLRRKDGSVERQHRLSVGSLPVAYTSDGSSDILYIMDRAVTSYNRDAGAGGCVHGSPEGAVEVA
eukprot:GHRQ01015983.1.p2 GENE.GHRQ01015983.1~~GHRQ01015983.1.p2  ORF type:complete len:215 (+),score=65.04 GHRQ01015983.1:583-1227(+)